MKVSGGGTQVSVCLKSSQIILTWGQGWESLDYIDCGFKLDFLFRITQIYFK